LKLPQLLNRESRRSLLVGLTPYQVLIASLHRREGGTAELDSAVEFDLEDEKGIRAWLDAHIDAGAAWTPVVVGVHSPAMLVQRHSVQPRRFVEEGYLAELANLSARSDGTGPWKLHLITPLEGEQVPAQGGQRPALLAGISQQAVHDVQQRLLDYRMLPYQLEIAPLALFAALYDRQTRANDPRAVVVVSIAKDQTVSYILGKEGVHTPAPLSHGFTGVVAAARKEMHLNEAQEVSDKLHNPDEETLLRASKFLRPIGRDLKAVIDSYELTTGQPVGDIYFDHLPPSLAWMAEPLAQIVGRPRYEIDCNAWMQDVGMTMLPGMPAFGPHWLGTLSLLASLPAAQPAPEARADQPFKGPWRIDCRLSAELPSTAVVGRKFLISAVAGGLAGVAAMIAVWQGYAAWVLRAEVAKIEARIEEKKADFALYEKAQRDLEELSAKVDVAWGILNTKVVYTDLLLELGRTKPPALRIDAILESDEGIVVRGAINEPSNRASAILTRYVHELRSNPVFQSVFTSILLTDLNRNPDATQFAYEINFRTKQGL
jgi:hypothetical protein